MIWIDENARVRSPFMQAREHRMQVLEFIEVAKAANPDQLELLGRAVKGVGKMRAGVTRRSGAR